MSGLVSVYSIPQMLALFPHSYYQDKRNDTFERYNAIILRRKSGFLSIDRLVVDALNIIQSSIETMLFYAYNNSQYYDYLGLYRGIELDYSTLTMKQLYIIVKKIDNILDTIHTPEMKAQIIDRTLYAIRHKLHKTPSMCFNITMQAFLLREIIKQYKGISLNSHGLVLISLCAKQK